MFGKPKPANLTRTLVGEWRADTLSGDVRGEITAVFNSDGTFTTRNKMDKQRFRLYTIDENGSPVSSTVRTFVDKNTMVNDIGRITFRRIDIGAN